MSKKRDEYLEAIKLERERQFNLPGSEWDLNNSPGDWLSLVSHYVNREVRKNGVQPSAEYFEASLIKAAAVILAALDNVETMKNKQKLK